MNAMVNGQQGKFQVMKQTMPRWIAVAIIGSMMLAGCGGLGNAPAATKAPAAATTVETPSKPPTAGPADATQTPDNKVATAVPKADNISFATAAVLGKDPIRLTVKDSQFYYKLAFSKGAVVTALLTVDAGSPEPATVTLYDDSQNFLVEATAPVGKSGPLRYVFSSAGGTGAFLVLKGNSSVTLSALSTPQNDGGTGGDAGQSFDTASAIKLGPVNGLLGDADANDYYAVDLPKTGGVLNIALQTSDNVIASLYDNSQNFIGELNAQKGEKTPARLQHILAADQGGQWFVKFNGNGVYTSTIAFGGQNDAGSGKDAGDDFASATVVKPGSYNGLLGGADTNDYYVVDLPKTGGAFSATVRTTDGSVVVTMYNDSQNFIGEANSDKNKKEAGVVNTILNGKQGGNWYVRISGEGSYEFSINWVGQNDAGSGKDAGEDFESALAVDKAEFDGMVGMLDSNDYFKIPAARGRKVNITFSGTGTLAVTLYNASQNTLKDATVDAGKNVDLSDDSGADGDYYIRVSGADGAGAYHVKINK
jgi:hypothetical protein